MGLQEQILWNEVLYRFYIETSVNHLSAQLYFVSLLHVLAKFDHHQEVHIFKREQLKVSTSLVKVLTASVDQMTVFFMFLRHVVFKYSRHFRVDAEEPTCSTYTQSEDSKQLTPSHYRNQN